MKSLSGLNSLKSKPRDPGNHDRITLRAVYHLPHVLPVGKPGSLYKRGVTKSHDLRVTQEPGTEEAVAW